MAESKITDTKEIEKHLNLFKASKLLVSVKVGEAQSQRELEGNLKEVTEYTATIKFSTQVDIKENQGEVSITRGNHIYWAICTFERVYENEAIVIFPQGMEIRVKRKHKRAMVEDKVFVNFSILEMPKSIHKEDISKTSPQLSSLYKELHKPVPDIKKIIPHIVNELKNFSPTNELKLYKEGEEITGRAALLKNYKMPLFIQNTQDSKHYLKNFPNIKVMSYNNFFKQLIEQGMDEEERKKEILKIMAVDRKNNLISYIYSPIVLFNEVIGHIFAGVVGDNSKIFRENDLFFVMALCDIISEAFAKSKIFHLEEEGAFESDIKNISAGGMLVILKDQYILKYLTVDSKLKLNLRFLSNSDENKIITQGKILRFDIGKHQTYMAVKFTELKWNEIDFINKYINNISA